MKITEILTKACDKVCNFYTNNKAEIKFAGGVVCSIGALYSMYRGTLKINDISIEVKDTMDRIRKASNDPEITQYTPEMAKKDTITLAGNTVFRVGKALLPTIVLEAASIALFNGAKNEYRTEAASLAALVASMSTAKNTTTERVITVDENGNVIKEETKETEEPATDPSVLYSFDFTDVTSPYRFAMNSNAANRQELVAAERYFNHKLARTKGNRVTFDNILEYLGLLDNPDAITEEQKKVSLVVGVRNTDNPNEDSELKFKITEFPLTEGRIGYHVEVNCYPLI